MKQVAFSSTPTTSRRLCRLVLVSIVSSLVGSGACKKTQPPPVTDTGSVEPPGGEDAGTTGSVEPPGGEDAGTTGEPLPPGQERVELFFSAGDGCDAVRSVERVVETASDMPTLVAKLLLEGPTSQERSRFGVRDPFRRGGMGYDPQMDELKTYLDRVVVEDGVAYVDFDDLRALEYLLAREACSRAATDAAFEQSLGALPGIEQVRYRVLGRVVGEEGGA